MNKLIVGCGYLGRRVARSWLADGHRVWALTRTASHAEELSSLGIDPIIGDICRPESLTSLPAVDTVLFAVGYDRGSGKSQREVYVDGLKSVLEVMAGTSARKCQRFLYISSSSVYGQSEGEWVDEASDCQPAQPGGVCCLEAEQLVLKYFASSHSDGAESLRVPSANILRLSGIYGPDRLLSRVAALSAGEPIAGRGDAWLNLIHVDDAVLAVRACEAAGRPGQIYLVSDNSPVTRGEYYGLLARLTGSPPPTFNLETTAKRGSGGINKRCSNRRIREELNLTLAYPTITAGLPHAIGTSADSDSMSSRSPRE